MQSSSVGEKASLKSEAKQRVTLVIPSLQLCEGTDAFRMHSMSASTCMNDIHHHCSSLPEFSMQQNRLHSIAMHGMCSAPSKLEGRFLLLI